jgi:HK97 family phage major capsid protein
MTMTDRTPNRPNDPRTRGDAWADTARSASRMPAPPEGFLGRHIDNEFRRYLTTGVAPERRGMNTTTGSAGAYAVPPAFLAECLLGVSASSAFGKARILSTPNGAPMNYPINLADTQITAAVQAEGSSMDSSSQPAFTNVAFPTTPTISMPNLARASYALENDSALPLEELLRDAFAQRLSRYIDKALVVALTAAATINVTSTAATGWSYADVINLAASLDQSVLGNAVLVCSPSAWKSIMLLQDGSQRPLALATQYITWNEDFAAEFGATARSISVPVIAGLAVLQSKSFAAATAGLVSGCIIDASRACIVRNAGFDVLRMQEAGAEKAESVYQGLARLDPRVADTNAFAMLTQHI